MHRNAFRVRVRAVVPVLLAAITLIHGKPVASAQKTYKILHTFTKDGKGGNTPDSVLILDQQGNLYGTAAGGGAHQSGTAFKLTPNPNGTWSESVLYSFCSTSKCADGSTPIAGLVFDASGNLYGTTVQGGANGNGTVFQLSPGSNGKWAESVLYSFCSVGNCDDGSYPAGSLIFDQARNLYSTTAYGGRAGCGAYGCGVVFKLASNPNGTWSESVLYSFCPNGGNCVDGAMPVAGLTFDEGGNLYGTGESGGSCFYCGVVFKLKHEAGGQWRESVLYGFCSANSCTDGRYPLAPVVFDRSGNLYGTTYEGGDQDRGIVFQLSPGSKEDWKEKIIHQFAGVYHGLYPKAGLVLDAAGNLYGTTYVGGDPHCYAIGCGEVFKLTPTATGWSETVLHPFYDEPGAFPAAGVTLDSAGNLYGTTEGHNNTFGLVFEITP